ncbi:hypothetical protein H4R34_002555 [Dimargaris verticillata]|uniref:Uncharacterized protein n=1 Tax=Dimargaris verticillata TaxID=2761393 RepID=A0A9W8B3P0_9FUNG|nr:hypothetical protein H4R34_002555 [Dimargaris verticillata]
MEEPLVLEQTDLTSIEALLQQLNEVANTDMMLVDNEGDLQLSPEQQQLLATFTAPTSTARLSSADTSPTTVPVGSTAAVRSTEPSAVRTAWTKEEDEALRQAVEEHGTAPEKWPLIAQAFPGRDNKSCRKRWTQSLRPDLRHGMWSKAEDNALRSAVQKHGHKWSLVAREIQGRTDDQCSKRWREFLDPRIDRTNWTPEDDARLLKSVRDLGSQWQKIAQAYFPGRPGIYCRNRWRRLMRHKVGSAKSQRCPLAAADLIQTTATAPAISTDPLAAASSALSSPTQLQVSVSPAPAPFQQTDSPTLHASPSAKRLRLDELGTPYIMGRNPASVAPLNAPVSVGNACSTGSTLGLLLEPSNSHAGRNLAPIAQPSPSLPTSKSESFAEASLVANPLADLLGDHLDLSTFSLPTNPEMDEAINEFLKSIDLAPSTTVALAASTESASGDKVTTAAAKSSSSLDALDLSTPTTSSRPTPCLDLSSLLGSSTIPRAMDVLQTPAPAPTPTTATGPSLLTDLGDLDWSFLKAFEKAETDPPQSCTTGDGVSHSAPPSSWDLTTFSSSLATLDSLSFLSQLPKDALDTQQPPDSTVGTPESTSVVDEESGKRPANDSTTSENRHLRRRLDELGLSLYGCAFEECLQAYRSATLLQQHLKSTHSDHPSMQDPSFRPFRCAMNGCYRTYKNVNGLHYHIFHSKGSAAHFFPAPDGSINEDLCEDKPYKCTEPNCRKKYKNANGLQYHRVHTHGFTPTSTAHATPTASSATSPVRSTTPLARSYTSAGPSPRVNPTRRFKPKSQPSSPPALQAASPILPLPTSTSTSAKPKAVIRKTPGVKRSSSVTKGNGKEPSRPKPTRAQSIAHAGGVTKRANAKRPALTVASVPVSPRPLTVAEPEPEPEPSLAPAASDINESVSLLTSTLSELASESMDVDQSPELVVTTPMPPATSSSLPASCDARVAAKPSDQPPTPTTATPAATSGNKFHIDFKTSLSNVLLSSKGLNRTVDHNFHPSNYEEFFRSRPSVLDTISPLWKKTKITGIASYSGGLTSSSALSIKCHPLDTPNPLTKQSQTSSAPPDTFTVASSPESVSSDPRSPSASTKKGKQRPGASKISATAKITSPRPLPKLAPASQTKPITICPKQSLVLTRPRVKIQSLSPPATAAPALASPPIVSRAASITASSQGATSCLGETDPNCLVGKGPAAREAQHSSSSIQFRCQIPDCQVPGFDSIIDLARHLELSHPLHLVQEALQHGYNRQ